MSAAASQFDSHVIGTYYRTHDDRQPAGNLTWGMLRKRASNPAKTPKLKTSLIVLSQAPGKTKEAIEAHGQMASVWCDKDSGDAQLGDLIALVHDLGLEAVIYSTASANRPKQTKDGVVLQGNRWRIVFILSAPLDCAAYLLLQEAIARYFGGGMEAVRIQQGLYGPTNPDGGYYEHAIVDGAMLDPHNLPPALLALVEEITAAQQEQEAKAKAAPIPKRVKVSGDSIIELVNQAYTVESILESNGFNRIGRRWLHPDSTSGMPGVIILNDGGRDYYYSHHSPQTDLLADGHRHDAFDLLVHWQFDGDVRQAIKDLAAQLDPAGQERRKQEWKEEQVRQNALQSVDDSHGSAAADAGDAKQPRYRLLKRDDLDALPPMEWAIKGILPRRGQGQIRGPSKSAKSFLAFDMGWALAEGTTWFGYRVKKTPVVFVMLEGASGVRPRKDAMERHTGRPLPENFSIILQPFSIITAKDVIDLATVVPKGAVVFIDTQNRAAPLIDENTSRDMGAIIEGAKTLATLIDGLVMLIAHTGKDTSRGPRGHSSQIPAFDVAIEVTREGDCRTWCADKVKDGRDGDRHDFRLKVIELGIDADGDPITSCVVVTDGAAKASTTSGLTHYEQIIAQTIERAGGTMTIGDLKQSFYTARRAQEADVKTTAINTSWHRALEGLKSKQIISVDGILVTATNRNKSQHCSDDNNGGDRYISQHPIGCCDVATHVVAVDESPFVDVEIEGLGAQP